ncbi:peptide chain release factor 3 [Euzebya tangerina]|uniref:peptide chain release factor 3 n=1 Tax=Euzebya tangerina TaxID=591198 RepID=UPI000E31CD60|nr:peptide chain release factor 3 [Euzebya tangerina]
MSTSTATLSPAAFNDAVSRRRTFAIISHPDAGKTTLTEKFLLYAGAVGEAGAVKSRRVARAARSDWMKLEQERGISISSTVLHFAYGEWRFNLLDTPGHADFSEDTYRTLCAADAAVMVLDFAKGLEPQTLKLFKVCADRGLPIVTFINKCDRLGMAPLGLLDQITEQIGMEPVPITWPVADGREFAGIVDRRTGDLHRYEDTEGGSKRGDITVEPFADADPGRCPIERWQAAAEELELLDLEDRQLDDEAFLAGRQTPVFFGSALQNFGVKILLEGFAGLAPAPGPAVVDEPEDQTAQPVEAPFSGQVFKVQANMNPRHRDRMAFVRVNSGVFERGMSATLARTGRSYQLKYAHQLFAADRNTVDVAVAGDIVGLTGATDMVPGDTLFVDDEVLYPPIPTFSPEKFASVRSTDTKRYKQFRRGLVQLDEEGVIHVLRRPEFGDQEPILAGVGQLQFEVAEHRFEHEFGCPVAMSPLPWEVARRIPADAADQLRNQFKTIIVTDSRDNHMALFASTVALDKAQKDHPDIPFEPLGTGLARRVA